MLAKRLAALAAFMPAGCVAADIGTDHASLPVFLIREGICPRVIATDINAGPFEAAARKVKDKGLDDSIDLRLGEGLKTLEPGEADVLVLAGMGGSTIRDILKESPQVLKAAKMLLLQPMAGAGKLRAWLAGNGWKISDEELVKDSGRIYVIVVAEQGFEKTGDDLLLELGPRLLEKRDPLLKEYLELIIGSYALVLDGLAAAKSGAAREKALEYREKLDKIRRVAGCL